MESYIMEFIVGLVTFAVLLGLFDKIEVLEGN